MVACEELGQPLRLCPTQASHKAARPRLQLRTPGLDSWLANCRLHGFHDLLQRSVTRLQTPGPPLRAGIWNEGVTCGWAKIPPGLGKGGVWGGLYPFV